MTTQNKKIGSILAGLLACLFFLGMPAGPAGAASVDINPDAFQTTVGEPFAVDVFVYNLDDGQSLDDFSFNVGYDKHVLGLDGYGLNSAAFDVLENATTLAEGDSRDALNFNVSIEQKTTASSYTLATITFSAISAVDYTSIDFDDRDGDGKLGANDVQLMADGQNIYSGDLNENFVVSAAPVPIPAAGWLLGAGIMGMAGLRRRARRGTI